MHSIKGSHGEVTDVGLFSDNADKTMFQFLEAFEIGYTVRNQNRSTSFKNKYLLS